MIESKICSLPLPARHLLDEEDIIMTNRLGNTSLRMVHLLMSVGCPFACHFCAVFQEKVQYRTTENIRNELEFLIEKYSIDGFAIVDDNFIVNKKKVIEICEAIKDLGLKWSALSRVDTVDRKVLQAMKKSGCIEIKFGIESGSNKLLNAMGKKVTREMIINAISLAYELGINVKAFLIHGFPGENTKTTEETINLMKSIEHMIDRVSLFRFVPLPGSFVFQKPEQFRLIKNYDAKWAEYHIHHNNTHWWGDENDFHEVEVSYQKLLTYINRKWPQ